MTNNPTGSFYDSIADKYHWFFSSWDEGIDKHMEKLVPILKEQGVRTVLDCACGTGLQTIGLARSGFRVVASDISKEMLKVAEQNAIKEGLSIEFIQCDFRYLDTKITETFDAVICMGNSIPHLLDDNSLLVALASINKRLDKNGIALFEMRNYDNLLKEKPKFLPMRINSEKDGKSVSILYVFDYNNKTVTFNVVYLIDDLATGDKTMKVESVDYNPIRKEQFIKLLYMAGFKRVDYEEEESNLIYIAEK